MTKSNPNKYRFPFSSAPKSIENGNPSFFGGPDLAVKDVVSALDGVTFNPESSVINGNDLVTTHKYSNYAELMNEAKSDNRQGGNSKVKSTGVYNTNEQIKENDVLGKVKGDLNSPNVDKINMIPYGSNVNNSKSFPAAEIDVESDFIKFRFRDIVNNKWLIFRAILEGITDTVTPEYGEERYIGRPDKVFTYQGVDKEIYLLLLVYIQKQNKNFPYLWTN